LAYYARHPSALLLNLRVPVPLGDAVSCFRGEGVTSSPALVISILSLPIRNIQSDLIDCGQAAGVHPVDLLVAATALGDGFTVLTDDGDYAHQIRAVRPELGVCMVGDGPG